jgi:uncharacterized membrane protein (UPF0127 family)
MRRSNLLLQARNQRRRLLVVLVAALVVVSVVVWISAARGPKLHAAGHTYRLEIAATEMQQEKGLGDRDSIPTDRGMLFTYTAPGRYCYWMKDMRFPLDIIWFDAQKRVVKIEQNLQPNTYPKTYCPADKNVQYVIELNAGQAAELQLQLGQQLKF